MQITWLGQAGFLIRYRDAQILVDPYFSDAVGQTDPQKKRRLPVPDPLWDIRPDMLLFTHEHLDHYDPQTAEHFLSQNKAVTVLAPSGCWQKARACGGSNNYVLFDAGTQWSEHGLLFTAVPAVHSDPCAIGFLISDGTGTVYITGDTLYHPRVLEALPQKIDAVFLPINGVGNNMNPQDAARFASQTGAALAIPIHWGMFDDIDPEVFSFENKKILKPYETMEVSI